MKPPKQPDFFDGPSPHYPERAGWKEWTTAKAAAERMEASGRAPTLRILVGRWFENGRESTADEVADGLGKSILSIRPRVAELHALELISETGATRTNDSGMSAKVWKWVGPER